MTTTYRTATVEDCDALAYLIMIASDGIIDFMCHDLIPGMAPRQLVSQNLKNDGQYYCYKNAVVACDGKDIVGLSLSFPSSLHGINDEMRASFPEDRLLHLGDFFSARVEPSWYLDALCVSEAYRRRGIGEKLISITKRKALDNGYRSLSLITFADNGTALSLYQRTGFKTVRKVVLEPNDYINHHKGCLLMDCAFSH